MELVANPHKHCTFLMSSDETELRVVGAASVLVLRKNIYGCLLFELV